MAYMQINVMVDIEESAGEVQQEVLFHRQDLMDRVTDALQGAGLSLVAVPELEVL